MSWKGTSTGCGERKSIEIKRVCRAGGNEDRVLDVRIVALLPRRSRVDDSYNHFRTPKGHMATRPQVIAGPDVPPTISPYSVGVRVGNLMFVSGPAGIDPSTGKPAGETFGEQARQVFRNLDAVLRAGGSNPTLVVNTTVLVADVSSFAELNVLFGESFSVPPPARMTMRVPLPHGVLISIGCVATLAA